jgi:hypothetical protein
MIRAMFASILISCDVGFALFLAWQSFKGQNKVFSTLFGVINWCLLALTPHISVPWRPLSETLQSTAVQPTNSAA